MNYRMSKISLKESVKGTLINIQNILNNNGFEHTTTFENYYGGVCGKKINEEKSLHIQTYHFKNKDVLKMEIHLYSDNDISIKLFKDNTSYNSFKFNKEEFKKIFKNFMKDIEINNTDIFNSLSQHFTIYPEHKNIVIESIKKQLKKELSQLIPTKKEHDLNFQKIEDNIATQSNHIEHNLKSLPLYEEKILLENQITELTLRLNTVNKQIYDHIELQKKQLIQPLESSQSIIKNLKSKIDSQFYDIIKKHTIKLHSNDALLIMDYVHKDLLSEPKKKIRREI